MRRRALKQFYCNFFDAHKWQMVRKKDKDKMSNWVEYKCNKCGMKKTEIESAFFASVRKSYDFSKWDETRSPYNYEV